MSPLSHPLDGAKSKLARARKHLHDVEAEVANWVDAQRTVVRSGDSVFGYELRAGRVAPLEALPPVQFSDPQDKLSTIIGDCVTNARAALDYAIWELAVRYFKPALGKGDRLLASFPIDTEETKFAKRLTKLEERLSQSPPVAASAIAAIKEAQTRGQSDDVLGWLNELVNHDKHRALLLVRGDHDFFDLTLATPAILQSEIGDGTARMRIPRRSGDANELLIQSNVQMTAEYFPYLSFGESRLPRRPIEIVLKQIIETVENIIQTFPLPP